MPSCCSKHDSNNCSKNYLHEDTQLIKEQKSPSTCTMLLKIAVMYLNVALQTFPDSGAWHNKNNL